MKLIDIAHKAGVSIGTASRVLSGKTDVNIELIERVQSASKALGYIPSETSKTKLKQELKSAMGTIGYLVDTQDQEKRDLQRDSFQQGFLEGMSHEISRYQGNVLFSSCQKDIETETLPSFVRDQLVTGVVLKVGFRATFEWMEKIRQKVPLAMMMHREESHLIPSVMCDNFMGVRQALLHLKGLGHQNVAFVSDQYAGVRPSLHHIEREEAFRKLTALLGFNEDPRLIQSVIRDPKKEGTLNGAMEIALNRLLALKGNRPTAIVCAADVYAFALMQVAIAKGLSLPKDLSLIGFMNTDVGAQSNPPLTSISVSEFEIGCAAIDLLRHQLDKSNSTVRHIVVGTELVERQSCARV